MSVLLRPVAHTWRTLRICKIAGYGILASMNPQILCELLTELEKEDPIDFSGLPFDHNDLRQLACLNVAELMSGWPQDQADGREMIMAATIARLVLENMVLNARIAILNQDFS